MKRRSWLWLILGIVLGLVLTLAAFKICIDRWFAPGTFELSEENIDRLENLDADAIYRLLSEEAADGRWEIISHVPSEDGGLGDIFVSGRADCQWAFGGAVKFSLRLEPNPDTEVYPPGEYNARYTRYGLDAVLEEKWSLWMGMSYVSFYTEDYTVSVRMYTAPDYNLGVSSVLDWLDEELSEAAGDFRLFAQIDETPAQPREILQPKKTDRRRE